MQTFLPYPDFEKTATVLDFRRLGKQRVETKQILLSLGLPVGEHEPKGGWSNHPAVKMWKGYEPALAYYGYAICEEWIARGYKDSLLPQFRELIIGRTEMPPWLGDTQFHLAHQSNLKRKDAEFYKAFSVADDLPYIWPV